MIEGSTQKGTENRKAQRRKARAAVARAETPAKATAAQTEDQKLFALFAASDEANLKRNPIYGLFRGDTRYADRLGDYLSDAYFDGERKANEADLAALRKIARAKLTDAPPL